jgi:uncharacterized protein (DUF433 family)
MDKQKLPERITANPTVYGGKPTIQGSRLVITTNYRLLET